MKNIFSILFLYLSVFCFPANANTILNSQRILTQLGFKPGPIDGAYGKKTKGALDEFYTSIGKNYDGLLDANELIELQKALNDSGLENTCNSTVQTKKTEGISKMHLETDFSSYFSLPIITDLPRYQIRTDGTLFPKSVKEFGNNEVKLIADFNNDNLDDIMIENYETNTPPIILFSKGNGEFDLINNLPKNTSRRHIRHAVAADFNNDGFLDIAGFTTGDPYKALGWPRGEQDILLINEGGKTFRNVKIPEWSRNDWNHGGTAADIDGDGLVDIIPVSEDSNRQTGPLKNYGNDVFKKGKTPYSSNITKEMTPSVVAGDLNNDGHQDLVFAYTVASGDAGFTLSDLQEKTIQVIYGDGDFNFNNNESISFGHHWLTPDEVNQNIKNQNKFRTGDNPTAPIPSNGYKFMARSSNVELIDINRDGLLDIIAGYNFSGRSLQMSSGFKIYVNQGNCFDDQTQIYFPNQRINRDINPGSQTAYMHGFYFEDISGDKLPDLILQMDGYMDFLSSKEPYHPNIFINNGSNIYLPLLKKNGPRLNFERYSPKKSNVYTNTEENIKNSLKISFQSIGDFDGDNRADFLFLHKGEHSSTLHVMLQRSPKERKAEIKSLIFLRQKKLETIQKANQIRLKENAKKLKTKAKVFAKDTSKQNSISLNKNSVKEFNEKLLYKTLPVNFTNVNAQVSKREGNYQYVSVDLKDLSVGNKKYDSFYFNLMIDFAPKNSPQGQTKLMRIQISGDGMLPDDALPELKKCKNISWKNTSEGIKIMYLIGNEAEINPCLLEKMHPDKRNFLGSIADALPNILKEGLYKNTKDLENILYLYFDAKEKEI